MEMKKTFGKKGGQSASLQTSFSSSDWFSVSDLFNYSQYGFTRADFFSGKGKDLTRRCDGINNKHVLSFLAD